MATRPPNILFFFPDQHRGDWIGANAEAPVRTPNLDRLASRGVRFTNAVTPSPLCSPARACLATARDYPRCGVQDNQQNTPLSLPNYYRHLRDADYEVCGVGKFDLHKPDLDWGLDGEKLLTEYGFTCGIDSEGKGDAIRAYRQNGHRPKGPYMQYLQQRGLLEAHYQMYERYQQEHGLRFAAVTALPDEAYCDNWIARNGVQFLRGFSADQPWHLVVNFTGPHDPFDVTSAMRTRWESVAVPEPVANDDPDRESIRMNRQNYAAMIENIDQRVGEMISVVEERGELENTLIVYASDHGEMLGDHGKWAKRYWYGPSAGVPLIVAGPGVRSGIVTDCPVSIHDLAPTFLECAGAEPLPHADAVSFTRFLAGTQACPRRTVFSGLDAWRMVSDGRHKLVLGASETPLLYDLVHDPWELDNVAASHPDLVRKLSALIEANQAGAETGADPDH